LEGVHPQDRGRGGGEEGRKTHKRLSRRSEIIRQLLDGGGVFIGTRVDEGEDRRIERKETGLEGREGEPLPHC